MQNNFLGKDVWKTTLRTIFFLGIAVFVSQFANYRGFENLKPLYIINITLDIFGMLVGYILLIGIYMDKRKRGNTSKFLSGIIIVVFISLFTDSIEYITDGLVDYSFHNNIVTIVYYITTPALAVLFWYYTINYLNIKNSKLPLINRLIVLGFIVSVIIRLLNLKYGFYYTIDKMGVYFRGPLYGWSKGYFGFVMLMSLTLIMIRRKQFRAVQLVAVFLYAFAPIVIGLTSIVMRGLSLTPITMMVVTLFMYCALNVTQGHEIAVAESEIAIASSIQENVLPKAFPYLPNRKEFDLYATMKPAKEVGGDFYDFFMVDDNHLALVIADVSGKGIPAALFMMTSRTLIKSRLQAGGKLSDILFTINNQLCEGNVADLFVTVWIGIIDLTTGHCVTANAGHEHPIIKRAGGKYEHVIYKHDFAVAMFENLTFKEEEMTLNHGDTIFVYTDGVTEAMNIGDELYGKDRLLEILNSDSECSPKEAIDKVIEDIKSFVGDAEQFDDTTMLCMKYNGNCK